MPAISTAATFPTNPSAPPFPVLNSINERREYWNRNAKRWQWIASPLRPGAEDIRTFELAVQAWHAINPLAPPQAVLLGVTPEIATMRWPAATRLVAADRSSAMIREVWPGARLGQPAICAEWSALPLRDESQDIIVGDGCFSALSYPDEYRALVHAMRHTIRENGLVLMRFFVRPEVMEPATAVVDDLQAGRIGNIHIFKWRLAMSLHGSLTEGVRLSGVWDAWHAAVPDPEQLAARLGWPLPAVLAIDAYRNMNIRYTFPTLAEVRATMAEAFSEIGCVIPGYELGERCPIIAFEPH